MIYNQCTWSEAKDMCESIGGYIATITSPEEQQIIDRLNFDCKTMWIGMHRDNNNNWSWVTGEPFDYSNWADGEPNNFATNQFPFENCGCINPSKWNDCHGDNINAFSGFICEWDNKEVDVDTVKKLIKEYSDKQYASIDIEEPKPIESNQNSIPSESEEPVKSIEPESVYIPLEPVKPVKPNEPDRNESNDNDGDEVSTETKLYNGHAYTVFDCSMSWKEAKGYCEGLGGHLVTVENDEENNFLISILGEKNYYWIGMKLDSNGECYWITGEEIKYNRFFDNEPDNYLENQGYCFMYGLRRKDYEWVVGDWGDAEEDGVSWDGDPFWNDNGFICEWDTIPESISADNKSQLKRELEGIDYSMIGCFRGHSYLVICNDNLDTWEKAKDYCVSLGGHLATIGSIEENNFLYSYIVNQGVQTAFFGYSDAQEEGNWVWVTGEKSEYTNWRSGEPSNDYNCENYAMFYYMFTDGTWNDGNLVTTLNTKRNYICEWEIEIDKE